MAERIRLVRASDLEVGPATPGMARSQAQVTDDVSVLHVRTEGGVTSGWHHHGDHTTYGFVVAGKLRFEFGVGGSESVEAVPGEFFMVPPQTIHRESNPSVEQQILMGLRIGSGPTVVNVDGPVG